MARLIFMGSASFAVPSLRALLEEGHEIALVVTRADKPKGRGLKDSCTPIKEFAMALGLPIFQPTNLKDLLVHEKLREVKADLFVVAAYGKILPPEVLSIPPRLPSGHYGCINVHGSLLPKYRGAAPVQWAIIKGERETGVTIMAMDEGMDTGPIIAQKRAVIEEEDTGESLTEKLAHLGARLLVEVIEPLLRGDLVPVAQDHTKASYAPMLKKEDGEIRWEAKAQEIRDLIRGVYSWPLAYTFLPSGMRLRIRPPTEVVSPFEQRPEMAGTVLEIEKEGMVVRCGDGSLLIRHVQPEGGRWMSPNEMALGRRLKVGMVLGGSQGQDGK